MRLTNKRATLLFCSVAVFALTGSAIARPVHKSHHSVHPVALLNGSSQHEYHGIHDQRYPFLSQASAQRQAAQAAEVRRHGRRRSTVARARVAAQSHANSAYGGFTTNSLVAEARKYIGTNPTRRSHLWCGAFMDMILRETGHRGGGNLALGYEHYGHRVSGPQVGAIAVMTRRGGGHVGVVSGVDANGNPIIVSGNHNHTVAESVYPRSRIAAYVMPGS
jgi:uncharacterized protein (TIGR02594 family)